MYPELWVKLRSTFSIRNKKNRPRRLHSSYKVGSDVDATAWGQLWAPRPGNRCGRHGLGSAVDATAWGQLWTPRPGVSCGRHGLGSDVDATAWGRVVSLEESVVDATAWPVGFCHPHEEDLLPTCNKRQHSILYKNIYFDGDNVESNVHVQYTILYCMYDMCTARTV